MRSNTVSGWLSERGPLFQTFEVFQVLSDEADKGAISWDSFDKPSSVDETDLPSGMEKVYVLYRIVKNSHSSVARDFQAESNFRALQESYGDYFIEISSYSTTTLAIRESELIPWVLWEIIEKSDENFLIDESTYANVEQEFIDEMWESYGKSDFESFVLDTCLYTGADLTDDFIKRLYMDFCENTGNYPAVVDSSYVEFHIPKVKHKGW